MNIPFRLNLEQQKKRAKELLNAFQQREPEAISRFQLHHPKLVYDELPLADFDAKLADAQLVIARELNCKHWNQLRQHIALMESLRDQIHQSGSVENEPLNCLHVRCGSDIQQTLVDAGFKGEFLEFSDPFCTGPVAYDYPLEARAAFLHESYGQALERDFHAIYAGLEAQYQTFRHSAERYKHVLLWFEHDTYDQFILIFLLSQYHRFGLPNNLWLVTTNDFPGAVRFQGLGQLPPEGIRLLWQTKQRVTAQQCAEADQHWAAFTDPDPLTFHHYVQNLQSSSIPYFKTAALRQLQEQPINPGQLSLTQQITIDLLHEKAPQTAGALFKQLMAKEPLPFLGDLMYWHILQEMQAKGLVWFEGKSDHWPETIVRLSEKRS